MTFPVFRSLMTGEVFTIKIPSKQAEVFLSNILRDYDKSGLKLALKSFKAHFNRYDIYNSNSKIVLIYSDYVEKSK